MKAWIVLIYLVSLLLISSFHLGSTQDPVAIKGKLLHVSDIHLDPTGQQCSDPSGLETIREALRRQRPEQWLEAELPKLREVTGGAFGSFGCDTQPALLQSFSDYLKGLLASEGIVLSGVIMSGDSVAHGIPSADMKIKAMSTIDQAISAAVGAEVPLYVTIGNNDVSPDYNASCSSAFYASIAADGYPGRIPEGQLPQWDLSASYAVQDPFGAGSGLLLSLDTVLFSAGNPNFAGVTDPCGAIAWLQGQLQDVPASTPVFLMGHIPPGVDPYSNTMLFAPQFQGSPALMKAVNSVSAGFFGHLHTDEFRLFYPGLPPVQFLQGSISPIYGENPSFRILDYEISASGLSILDYQQYYFDLAAANELGVPQWAPSYAFSSEYGLPDCSSQSYADLWHDLSSDYSTYLTWKANTYSLSGNSAPAPPNSTSEYLYVCAQRSLNTTVQQLCVSDLI